MISGWVPWDDVWLLVCLRAWMMMLMMLMRREQLGSSVGVAVGEVAI